jgi:hypothetical protein
LLASSQRCVAGVVPASSARQDPLPARRAFHEIDGFVLRIKADVLRVA